MNLNEIICGLVGHKPFRPQNKKKWRRDCLRCGKVLVAHNPHPNPAPYKIEPASITLNDNATTDLTIGIINGIIKEER